MANAKDYAEWLAANADKKGTPDYETMVQAWKDANIPEASTSPARVSGAQFARENPVASFGITAGQGATFNFADELAGLTRGALSPNDFAQQYRSGRDFVRGATEQYGEEHPVLAPIAGLAGGLATGGPAALAATRAIGGAAGKTLAGRLAKSSATGGILGGVAGAGSAEDVESMPWDIAKSGAFGAVAPMVINPIVSGVRGGYNALMSNFTGAGARNVAQQRVANAIAQDRPAYPPGPMAGAERDPAAEAGARLTRLGPEARIADSAGQSTRDLLDTMATLPGVTRERVDSMLRARTASVPQRLDAIPTALNQGHRAAPTLEALQQVKEAASRPLYKAVENKVVPITPALEALMQRPAFKEAFDQAVTNAANRGEQLPLLEDLMKAGPVSGVKVKFWDDVKKGLDDVIAAKKRGLGVQTPSNKNQAQSTLQSSLDIKHELVSEVDRLTGGAYKLARDAYAGPAAMQVALEDGMKVWTMSAPEITAALAKMSASEQQAFRMGAGELLREKVGSPRGQAELLNAWKDRNVREKLQVLFGDAKTYREALSTLFAEERLRRLQRVGQGSQTARREAGMEDFNLGALSDVAAAAGAVKSGSFTGMLDAARKAYNRVATPEPVRDEVGRILMSSGQAGQHELTDLQRIIREITERNARQQAITGVMGSSILR